MRLIEQVWFNNHKAKYILLPLLLPLSGLFLLLSAFRRLLFRQGVITSRKSALPVIVVGNIGVGGNGKTPVVIHLVEQCLALGLKPGVISRGYGSKAPNYPYLVNENSSAIEAGDEPLLIYQRTKVPVAIGADRLSGAKMLHNNGCDIVIADDGLQHYKLARDLEIIVVDGKRLFGNGFLLPAGPLREGQWRLRNAGQIILNGQTLASAENKHLINGLPMSLSAQYVVNVNSGEKVSLSDFIETNNRVNALAGIGDPSRFFSTLTEHYFSLDKAIGFVDHHQYIEQDLVQFSSTLPLLMTEKDAVKCRGFANNNCWYLPVEASFTSSDNDKLVTGIKKLVRIKSST